MELWRQDLAWKFHLALHTSRPAEASHDAAASRTREAEPALGAPRRVHSDSELRLSDHEEQ